MIVKCKSWVASLFPNAARRSWRSYISSLDLKFPFFFNTYRYLAHSPPYSSTLGVQEHPWDLQLRGSLVRSNPRSFAFLNGHLVSYCSLLPLGHGMTLQWSTPSWKDEEKNTSTPETRDTDWEAGIPTFHDKRCRLSKPGHCHLCVIPTQFHRIDQKTAIDCGFIEVQGSATRTRCNKFEIESWRVNWRSWSI